MSCVINLLYLTGSIFMLEIYDRVLPSRSVPTLVGLVVLAGGLYVAQGVLDLFRGRILSRIGTALDEALNARVFETVVRLPLQVGGAQRRPATAARPRQCQVVPRRHGAERVLRPAMAAVLSGDLLCIPLADRRHRAGRRRHPGHADFDHRIVVARAGQGGHGRLRRARSDIALTSRRNAEVLVAMGMAGRLRQRWSEANDDLSGRQSARQRCRGRTRRRSPRCCA